MVPQARAPRAARPCLRRLGFCLRRLGFERGSERGTFTIIDVLACGVTVPGTTAHAQKIQRLPAGRPFTLAVSNCGPPVMMASIRGEAVVDALFAGQPSGVSGTSMTTNSRATSLVAIRFSVNGLPAAMPFARLRTSEICGGRTSIGSDAAARSGPPIGSSPGPRPVAQPQMTYGPGSSGVKLADPEYTPVWRSSERAGSANIVPESAAGMEPHGTLA